ncbi:MAG: hypothetical protein H6Q68_548 [Firmicutes bacterium]|nr:hypothetical protein [Bacillota bacterium]
MTAIHYRLLGGLEMNIEQRICQLRQKLMVLGYYPFQVKRIMQTVMENNDIEQANVAEQLRIVNVLENYEKLANDFSFAYSK